MATRCAHCDVAFKGKVILDAEALDNCAAGRKQRSGGQGVPVHVLSHEERVR